MIVLCGVGIDYFLYAIGAFHSSFQKDLKRKCVDCRASVCDESNSKIVKFALKQSEQGCFSFIPYPDNDIKERILKSGLSEDEVKVVYAKGKMVNVISDHVGISATDIRKQGKELLDDAKKYGWETVGIDGDDYSTHDLYRDLRGRCGLHCCGCGKSVSIDKTNYFMLHDELWKKICKKGERNESDVLCKRCCELILGRKLTRKDLNDAPVNDWLEWK